MYSSKYRHPMTLKTKTITRSSYGQSVTSYTGSTVIWCAIEPANATDYQQFRIEGTEFTHKITTRYHPSITVDSKLEYNSITYDIVSLLDTDLRAREYTILAKEDR